VSQPGHSARTPSHSPPDLLAAGVDPVTEHSGQRPTIAVLAVHHPRPLFEVKRVVISRSRLIARLVR